MSHATWAKRSKPSYEPFQMLFLLYIRNTVLSKLKFLEKRVYKSTAQLSFLSDNQETLYNHI